MPFLHEAVSFVFTGFAFYGNIFTYRKPSMAITGKRTAQKLDGVR